MTADTTRISKTLSFWLRHKPEAGGLQLTSEGWARIADVLKALHRQRLSCNGDMLATVVATSDKKRFELSDDGRMIRARQGHSVDVDLKLEPIAPPPVLFHGTVDRFLTDIFSDGLKPMQRQHVHLSKDLETATKVGARRGKPVILRVASGTMAAGGHLFYLSSNGVWLTDHVPPEYLEKAPL